MDPVSTTSVFCGKCRQFLLSDRVNTSDWTFCNHCGAEILVHAFPALIRPLEPARADTLLSDGGASCFYHVQKKAVISCSHCGRFLCALCDIEMNDQHFCPQCLDTGKKKGRMKNLENFRILYDQIAFSLAVLPVLLFPFIYFSFITAPLALYITIRYWNAPTSLIPRTRVRFLVAILFAVAQIIGWILLIYYLIST